MRRRVPSLNWTLRSLCALAVLVASSAAAIGQSPVPSFIKTGAEPAITFASEAPAAISSLLEKGRSLETAGRWAEALSYYEEALREHPSDRSLESRFDVARLHYNFEQRQADRSFVDSVRTLRAAQARELFADLLNKIDAHYYTTPPWQDLTRRGARSMDVALADEGFLRANSIKVRGPQVDQLRNEIVQLTGRYAIRSRDDATAVTTQVARLARERIGLAETATWLEFTAAVAGGLDHYSAYLSADQLRDIYSQIEGNFVGLGVELKADDGALLVVNVIRHSPAEASGIRPGDRIIGVDGRATRDLSTDAAAALLTGPEGSVVRVTMVTPGQGPRELAVRRAEVEVPSLEDVKIVEPASGVAYLRIPAFQKTTANDLEAALWDLHKQGMRSLVMDLRGNPGGLLTASVEVADKFIADGGIVSTRGRSEQENFNYRAHRPGTWRVPLVVLIDGDSASASEIFAAAIKDSGRGTVVGTRSYGKGSVQGIFPLSTSGAGARITTAKFYSPNGNAISNVGVTPDVDARRATVVAGGREMAAVEPDVAHQVGFRGADTNALANMSPLSPAAGDDISPSVSHEPARASSPAAAPAQDPALEIAVEVARKQPVAQL
ncbi:MAG: S41 family peptidase [Pirellulales bacterium]